MVISREEEKCPGRKRLCSWVLVFFLCNNVRQSLLGCDLKPRGRFLGLEDAKEPIDKDTKQMKEEIFGRTGRERRYGG